VVNVYCLGSLKKKRVVWEELVETRRNHPIKMWCVVEDFNYIRLLGREEVKVLMLIIEMKYIVLIILLKNQFG